MNLSQRQSDAWHDLEGGRVRRVLYGGAAGGGKTYLACVWQIHRRLSYPESAGFIARNILKTIKESTLVTFLRVAQEFNLQFGTHFTYNDTYGLITFANGSREYLKELKFKPSDPEFTDLGSTEFTDGVFEECTEITEKAYDILNSRIRYVKSDKHGWSLTPVSLATCNPSRSWVKNRYISDDQDRPVVLKPDESVIIATLDDNPDKDFVSVYDEQLKGISGYDYARLRFGDWNVKPAPKSPFAVQFSDEHISTEPQYDPHKPLLIGLDFNIDPFAFNFYHHWRDAKGEHLHVFDERTIFNASINDAIEYIRDKYPLSLPTVRITGDPGGSRREFSQRDNASLYTQLIRGLKIQQKQVWVPPAPHHPNSRTDCNYFLMHFPDFKVHRDRCPNLIFDLRYVEVDEEQHIIKARREQEQQRADHLDNFRYIINTFFKKWIADHQKYKR